MATNKKDYVSNFLLPFLYLNIALFVLLLSFFNLTQIKKSGASTSKVLGVKTDKDFWIDFVEKHPTYRDGWIELGRLDKIKQIDPNFGRN